MICLLFFLIFAAVATPALAVDGACGTSDGSAVSSAPSTGLCSAGVASVVSGNGPYAWVCIGTSGGSSANCSATPASSYSGTGVCGPSEVFAGADANWSPLTTTQIFPLSALSATGDSGRAIKFVADAVAYPHGIIMEVVDQTPQLLPKDAVISNCPHNFSPVGGQSTCVQTDIGNIADIGLLFGGTPAIYDCILTPGATYYLNFRDSITPRGTVYSQFNNLAR